MPRKKLLLDTGPLVALLDKRDSYHAAALRFFTVNDALMITTWPVISEACHLVPRHLQPAVLGLIVSGDIGITDIFPGIDHIADLLVKYADIEPDFADISLVYAAEKLKLADIVTIDSDFAVYRINGRKRFQIVGP